MAELSPLNKIGWIGTFSKLLDRLHFRGTGAERIDTMSARQITAMLIGAVAVIGAALPAINAGATAPTGILVAYRSSFHALGHGRYAYSVSAAAGDGERLTLPRARSAFTVSGGKHPDNQGNYTDCQTDGSVDVETCVNLDYMTYECRDGVYCGTIYHSNLTYRNLDPTHVQMPQAKYVEYASGRCHQGCSGTLAASHDFGWHAVTSGHTYGYTGYWSGKFTELLKSAAAWRGSTSTLDWDFRGRSYQLVVKEALNDNGSGGSER